MFIGHYGVSFAAKAIKPSIPLWVLFLAVQIVDVFWAIFVLLGIEKVRIVPGITAANPLDLYYMPYTHGLITSLVWATGAAVIYRFSSRIGRWGSAAIVGIAVFSHWVFDLIVHRPDLPLYDNSYKVGLGLWNFPVIAFSLEVALLLGGMYLYLKTTRTVRRGGFFGMLVFGLVMIALQSTAFLGSPPTSPMVVTISALISFFLFTSIAFWLEQKRDLVVSEAHS